MPSKVNFNRASKSESSSSIARYLVTLLFKTGLSNSTKAFDKLPSCGSKTVKSYTAPAAVPLIPLFNIVLPSPKPFKYLLAPIKPVIN